MRSRRRRNTPRCDTDSEAGANPGQRDHARSGKSRFCSRARHLQIPGRDCEPAGAVDEAAYENWIGAFARGIGGGKAVVILEPDSLANLPSDSLKNDSSLNATTYPFSDAERLAEINYSVAAIEKDPHVSVYLDGGNSAWQPVGTIAEALIRAGVENAQGFVLNVSSNRYTANGIA